MPLLHSRPNKATFNGLLDKVHRRLAGWKGKLLSLDGRATLIKAVASSIPIYTMQTTKLHASVCEELDKLNRILHGADLLVKGIGWRIGNRDQVKFWQDKWLNDEPLLKHHGNASVSDLNCHVSHFVKGDWWDIDKLKMVLVEEVMQQISSIPVDFFGTTPDAQIWNPTPNEVFSAKSAYSLFFKPSEWSDSPWNSY
ncbi:unnamed protein product [Prunus brigantina]